MDLLGLLNNKAVKSTEKRAEIAEALRARRVTIKEIQPLKAALDDKKIALVLEAMEAVSNKNPEIAELEWLHFARDFILSKSNSAKREASRVVGNIARLFPDDLRVAVQYLLENTGDGGTVVRWGSAYALARIIQIPAYANSELYDTLTGLCEQEQENGVKNQLLNGLKKAKKVRTL